MKQKLFHLTFSTILVDPDQFETVQSRRESSKSPLLHASATDIPHLDPKHRYRFATVR